MLTSFYSLRLISMTFLTTPNAAKMQYEKAHEQDLLTMLPLLLLALLSIFFGYVAKDAFVGMGSDMLASSLVMLPSNVTLVEAEFALPSAIKLLPAIGTAFAAALALVLYHKQASLTVLMTQH